MAKQKALRARFYEKSKIEVVSHDGDDDDDAVEIVGQRKRSVRLMGLENSSGNNVQSESSSSQLATKKTRTTARSQSSPTVSFSIEFATSKWKNPAVLQQAKNAIAAVDPRILDLVATDIEKIYSKLAAESSLATYASAVRSLLDTFSDEENKFYKMLLPATDYGRLAAIFAPRVSQNWSTTQLYMSALASYHKLHGFAEEFEAVRYSGSFQLFWDGLKQNSDKSGHGKRPVTIDELRKFVEHCTASNSTRGRGYATQAQRRDATMAVVAFMGIKRVSEVCAIRRQDVKKLPGGGFEIFIAKQKQGNATSCSIVPFGPKAKQEYGLCPADILSTWLVEYDKDRDFTSHSQGFLFPKTKGNRKSMRGDRLPTEAFRSSLREFSGKHFTCQEDKGEVSCHSLRKGGALFWLQFLDRSGVRSQGGWLADSSMEDIYLAQRKSETTKRMQDAMR